MRRIGWRTIFAAVLLVALLPAATAHASASFMAPDNKQEAAGEYDEQLLKLAEKYTPEQVSQWKEELAERSELRAKLKELKKNGALSKLHEQMQQEIRSQVESGKLTREEAEKMMKEKHKDFVKKHKEWKENGKKLRGELEQAVKKNDNDAIAKALDALLERLSKTNETVKERLQLVEQ